MNEGKNIGIWLRVSTDMQVQGDSPEHHEKRARLYAESKGWNVVEVYRLNAVSGKSVMSHAETQRMLSDVKNSKISGLVFSKLARLARNTKELLEFSEIFRTHSCDLISLSESIDTSSPAGRLFYTVISALNQFEREEIADRVAASVPIRAKLGKPLGGQASFGYRWQGKDLVVNEKEAPIRKLLYEIFKEIRRKKTTADELNKRGYRMRNGGLFTATTVSRLLRDPAAKGERRANYTKSTGEGKGWKMKDESEWVITPCPAVVSAELWNECNEILDQQERTYTRPGPKANHLLGGYVLCGCGTKMYVHHGTHYACKNCKNKIAESDLDEIFYTQLLSYTLPNNTVNIPQHFKTLLSEKESLFEQTTNTIKTLQTKSSMLINLRIAGEMDAETFAIEHKPVEAQIRQLEAQISTLEGELDYLRIHSASTDIVLQDTKHLYDQWETLAFEDKRSIVETITEQVLIDKSDITITLTYLPRTPSSELAGKGRETMPMRLL